MQALANVLHSGKKFCYKMCFLSESILLEYYTCSSLVPFLVVTIAPDCTVAHTEAFAVRILLDNLLIPWLLFLLTVCSHTE